MFDLKYEIIRTKVCCKKLVWYDIYHLCQ